MRVNSVRKLLWGLCGILAVALVAAAWGAYRVVAGDEAAGVAALEPVRPTEREGSYAALGDYADIWRLESHRGPGGEAAATPAPKAEVRVNGVVIWLGEGGGVLPELSYAYVEDGEGHWVKGGDAVGEWKVVRVEAGGVVMKRGEEEKLFPVEERGTVSEGSTTLGAGRIGPVQQARGVQGVSFAPYVKQVSNVRREVQRGFLDAVFKDKSTYEAVVRGALFVPHESGGESDGVEVKEVGANSLAAELGLKEGDVVVRVNGEPVVGIDVLSWLPKIAKQPSVEVTVLRGGTTMTLYYDIRE